MNEPTKYEPDHWKIFVPEVDTERVIEILAQELEHYGLDREAAVARIRHHGHNCYEMAIVSAALRICGLSAEEARNWRSK